ncbi:phenol hydroxylase subunit P4 [Caldimonas tepidiphila]|uniref:phenol hydroxylase subunit P4 n=1 Tax=Caldimonas tepidiphila TaxID=2315841 RepID=UPI000E5ADE85|nr:phenol hydroxylase subunit P4 [Caldimonas tepidiphila]
MSVVAVASYEFTPRDARERFPAPLLYIGWDRHLAFCAPVCVPLPPDMPFGALATAVLPGIYGWHPDFAQIDWSSVQWLKSGQPWTPDPAKSLADNGLGHKSAIRFRTPGLDGIRGTGI